MPAKLNKNDRELLVALAEYRLLTVSQIAALGRRLNQAHGIARSSISHVPAGPRLHGSTRISNPVAHSGAS